MEVTIIRSFRRTMALEIDRNGNVIVRAPQFVREKEITKFVQEHSQWIQENREKQLQKIAARPEPTEAEKKLLREKAKLILPPKVDHYASIMGVKPEGITITSARTRFGSCSGKNRLSFSLYLMQYPEDAIDYVVVHELAHIRHHDHSPAFYAEVEKVMPDYKRRQKILKA